MTNWRAVVRAMEIPVAESDQPLKTVLRSARVGVWILIVVYLGFLLIAYNSIVDAWKTNGWDDFNTFVSLVAQIAVLLPVILGTGFRPLMRRNEAVLKARQAAIVGDDTLAPLAAQPSMVETGAGDEPLALYTPTDGKQRGKRAEVHADDKGLSWRQGRRHMSIAWHEAQAFTTVQFRRNMDGLHFDIYALGAPNMVLAWELTKYSTEAERAAHRYLSSMIASRTSLRLRDLTASIENPEQGAATARKATRSTSPEPLQFPLPTVPATVPPLAESPIPHVPIARKRPKLSLGYVGAALLLLLPGLLVFPLGWGAQQYEPHYYGTILQRIHAEQPLYQDSFAYDNGDWLVQQSPTSLGSERYAYVNSAYQLDGGLPFQFMESQRRHAYTDVAVEVTTQLIGDDGLFDAIGLELRVSDNPCGAVVFTVDEHTLDGQGEWYLSHCTVVGADGNNWGNWDYTGYSNAIHTGSGAKNRLLVLLHGNQLILFVNDTYLGTETVDALPATGNIGVFSEEGTLTARFTNFAIYPLPSLAPPLPWAS